MNTEGLICAFDAPCDGAIEQVHIDGSGRERPGSNGDQASVSLGMVTRGARPHAYVPFCAAATMAPIVVLARCSVLGRMHEIAESAAVSPRSIGRAVRRSVSSWSPTLDFLEQCTVGQPRSRPSHTRTSNGPCVCQQVNGSVTSAVGCYCMSYESSAMWTSTAIVLDT